MPETASENAAAPAQPPTETAQPPACAFHRWTVSTSSSRQSSGVRGTSKAAHGTATAKVKKTRAAPKPPHTGVGTPADPVTAAVPA
jgi:hypothetical protein